VANADLFLADFNRDIENAIDRSSDWNVAVTAAQPAMIDASISRIGEGIQGAIGGMGARILASDEATRQTLQQGFGRVESSITPGFANIGVSIGKMSRDVCERRNKI
jgi:hypothetical protein